MASGALFGECQRCGELVWEDEEWDFVGEGTGIIEHTRCQNEGVQTITVTGIVLARVVKNGVMTLVVDIGDQDI